MNNINNRGFSEILRMVIIISFIAVIYMTGIYVWQYIETERKVAQVIHELNMVLQESQQKKENDIDFSHGSQGGCDNIFLYSFNKERTSSLSIDINVKELGLINEKKAIFSINENKDNIKVKLYRGDFVGFLHCTDKVPDDLLEYEEIEAQSGQVGIVLKNYNFVDQYIEDYEYSASAMLKDIVFMDNNGQEIFIGEYVFDFVDVGWTP